MKQKEKLVLFSILVVLAVIAVITVPSVLADIPPSKAYPANATWFDPENTNATYCNTVDVDVWMNTTVAVTGFRANFTYTQCCANVTEVVYFNTTNWDAACRAALGPGYVILLGRSTKNPGIPAGLIHWGTLKIHCCNDTAECLTNLAWNHADPMDIYIEGPRPDMLEITPVTWYDGKFTCESQEKPDLVVDKSVEFNEDSKFVVSYTVTNIGDGPAGESTTCKYVDGVLQETQPCPALAPDASHSGAFDAEECPCGERLNVTVCADNDDVVDESDETNNCEVNFVDCPYIEVDIRADGIASNIFDAADYMICPGTVTEDGITIDNETAMGAVVAYCQDNGINVQITMTGLGEYVVQIGNDPADNNSWMYAVNEEVPPVGGAQKVIVDGDRVHWYNYNLNYYSVITALDKTEIVVGESLTATVTWKNITGIHLLNGASVHVGVMGPWGPEPGASVGTTGVDGTCTFPWSEVGTWGVYAVDPVHGSGIYNYPPVSLNCSTEEKPDLVVEKSVTIGDGNFTVNYTVSNIGTAPANGSTICKYVDGERKESQACPALGPGESHNGTFVPEPCPCGSTLNVTVCADNDNDVDESDETNNCKVNIIECPYIEVDIRADGIASNTFDAAGYMICPGTVTEDGITIDNETAMGAVVAYCQDNGINVQITMTGLGEYVVQIGNDPADNNSWMYAVSEEVPPVGGAQKVIVDGDRVHWYNYNLNYYSVITALDKTEIVVGESLTATVTWKNITGIHLLNGASVHVGVMGPWGPEPGASVGSTGVDGTCTFPWSEVGTWGVYAVDPVHGSGIYNYPPVSLNCSTEEKPDLVVEKSVTIGDGNFTVNYTVSNIGTAPANGSTTCKYVDGERKESQACPALGPGEGHNGTFVPEPCPCGSTLNVTVCADNDNDVDESDETNNCKVNIIECPYIEVDIRADGIASNTFDAAGYMICPGTVTEDGITIDNETAMGAVVAYCQDNGINVQITMTGLGEYVVQIGNDPADNNSWMYAVNEEVPPVGGAQKVIVDGDRVHWYNYNLNYYSVITALDKTEIVVGESLTATVTWKNITGIHLLNGASVHVGVMGPWGPNPGASVGSTGVDGTCTFPWSEVGIWGVYAVDPVHGSGIYNYPPVTFTCRTETEKINETEYQKKITQPVDVSKIRYKFTAVNEEWAALWTTVLLYGQEETKYSIEIRLNKAGYVTRVDFERWGFPIAEIPVELATQSLAKLNP